MPSRRRMFAEDECSLISGNDSKNAKLRTVQFY